MSDRKKTQIIKLEPAVLRLSVNNPTIWISENIARDWFNDAINEVINGIDRHARRREIIFSVCFAETYFFEWVRRINKVGEIFNYFPHKGFHRGIIKTWKRVLKQLYDNKKIKQLPELNYNDFELLIKFRNGYIHALARRPKTDKQINDEKPIPTRDEIEMLTSGWALESVIDLIKDLHIALDSKPEEYITKY